MNPLHMPGPEFLGVFIVLFGAAFGARKLGWRLLRAPGGEARPERLNALTPYEVAYLGGGPAAVVDAAVTALVHEGRMTGLERARRSKPSSIGSKTSSLEARRDARRPRPRSHPKRAAHRSNSAKSSRAGRPSWSEPSSRAQRRRAASTRRGSTRPQACSRASALERAARNRVPRRAGSLAGCAAR